VGIGIVVFLPQLAQAEQRVRVAVRAFENALHDGLGRGLVEFAIAVPSIMPLAMFKEERNTMRALGGSSLSSTRGGGGGRNSSSASHETMGVKASSSGGSAAREVARVEAAVVVELI